MSMECFSLYVILLIPSLICFGYAQCPTDFTEVISGVCMIAAPVVARFCGSFDYCEQEGMRRGLRLIVPGRHYLQIKRFLTGSSIIYTGLTNMLNRSGDYLKGWRYSDPGWASFETPLGDTDIQWAPNRPTSEDTIISVFNFGDLIDASQKHNPSTDVVCEVSNVPVNTSTETFTRDWPHPIPSMFLSSIASFGCFNSYRVPMLAECARRWALN